MQSRACRKLRLGWMFLDRGQMTSTRDAPRYHVRGTGRQSHHLGACQALQSLAAWHRLETQSVEHLHDGFIPSGTLSGPIWADIADEGCQLHNVSINCRSRFTTGFKLPGGFPAQPSALSIQARSLPSKNTHLQSTSCTASQKHTCRATSAVKQGAE